MSVGCPRTPYGETRSTSQESRFTPYDRLTSTKPPVKAGLLSTKLDRKDLRHRPLYWFNYRNHNHRGLPLQTKYPTRRVHL